MNDDDEDIGLNIHMGHDDDDEDIGMNIHSTLGAA